MRNLAASREWYVRIAGRLRDGGNLIVSIDNERNSWDDYELCVRTHWTRICGVLLRVVGDPAEAEDLALEAFWKLYKHRPHPGGSDSIGWLYRVAINLGLNALRAKKRRLKYEQEAVRTIAADSSSYPAEAQHLANRRQLVRRTLARMKRGRSHILLLRYSGLSYAEIAVHLGKATGSIGSLLTRAEREFEKEFHKLKGE